MQINDKKSITVLGSTGSVGTQALDVARLLHLKVNAVSCADNIKLAEEQIREFKPDICAVVNEKAARELSIAVADTYTRVISGEESVCEAASYEKSDLVINAVTGIAGLKPSLAVINAGKTLALANKETVVTAGELVMKEAKEKNVTVIPVDSEHSAVFQCLSAGTRSDVENIILTASGGPFFGMTKERLSEITPEIALNHPTWKMGAKISIDSATLMNKGFEVMEAIHLFGISQDSVKVIIHRESIIHSLVEYKDKSMIALLSCPDMRLCVQYAVTYPERAPSLLNSLNLAEIGKLTFAEPDTENFALLSLAYRAAKDSGNSGAILNGANEVAVGMFLDNKISFTGITDVVTEAYESVQKKEISDYNDVFEADMASREAVRQIIGR
ncbi:MAG: 1-deoxy-D-xylulose-5-phosphate reductoisomerase [Clostridia bacterium]|nr:1-deoxy-D-xylulose-5-phosphate reductoisomerase [Clostridia bacterium]